MSDNSATFKLPTVTELLKSTMKSGLGIDASKNHTGLCMFDGETVTTVGFSLPDVDETDVYWEYKMRRAFKEELLKYIGGKFFQVIIIEDVYGGENFDTVRKLLALQGCIDDLIFENKVFCEEFYREKEPTWLSDFRKLHKSGVGIKAKVETQAILEFLNFDFYLEHKDNPDNEKDAKARGIPSKASIFFEDRCDATAQLLSIASKKIYEKSQVTEKHIKFSDIKLEYNNAPLVCYSNDVRIRSTENPVKVTLNTRNLKQSILDAVEMYPDKVMVCYIPVAKLGVFGKTHNFRFYPDGDGWLFFYVKGV